jgi:DNA-binding Lrp family transcriptional regulator
VLSPTASATAARPLAAPDRQLLLSLAEHRVAVLDHAARWLGLGPAAAARRVRRLERAGLLERRRVFHRGSATLRITAAGLRAIDSPLGPPGLKLDEYRHDVGVTWLWTAAREGAFGDLAGLETERGMRSRDSRLDRRAACDGVGPALWREREGIGLGTYTASGRPERHYPDLLLRTREGARVAVELELSSKGRRRLDRVLGAYARDGRVQQVLYLVADARIGTQVAGAAARAGIAARVSVRLLAGAGIGGVDPGWGPSRERVRSRAARAPERSR